MQRFLLSVVTGMLVVGGLAWFTGPAGAREPSQDRHHEERERRDFDHDLRQRDAHRYPLTYEQHERLHDALEHEAFHDRPEHREFDRPYYQPYPSYYPPYPGYGFGYQGGNFSLYLGR